jgi:hypothetical protein
VSQSFGFFLFFWCFSLLACQSSPVSQSFSFPAPLSAIKKIIILSPFRDSAVSRGSRRRRHRTRPCLSTYVNRTNGSKKEEKTHHPSRPPFHHPRSSILYPRSSHWCIVLRETSKEKIHFGRLLVVALEFENRNFSHFFLEGFVKSLNSKAEANNEVDWNHHHVCVVVFGG